MLFVLHMEGLSSVTKQNIILETLGNVILLMLKVVVMPHRTTSEPIEHFFGHLRMGKSEFTALDFAHLVLKVLIRLRAIFHANLRISSRTNKRKGMGYQSTMDTEQNNKQNIMNDEYKPYEGGDYSANEFPSFSELWNELYKVLSPVNKKMKTFLSNLFGVTCFHNIITDIDKSHTQTRKYFTTCFSGTSTEDDDEIQQEWEILNAPHSHVHNDEMNHHYKHDCNVHCDQSSLSSTAHVTNKDTCTDDDDIDKLLHTLCKVKNINPSKSDNCPLTDSFHEILNCTKWDDGSMDKTNSASILSSHKILCIMRLMLMDDDYKTTSVEEKKTNIHGRYIRQTSKRVSKSTWVEKECIERGSIIQFTHIPKKTFEVMCFSRKK